MVLAVAGVLQTMPSLALLVFMIPLVRHRHAPAIVALFLYSLLPIVRNTHAGLADIPPELRESAAALGLPRGARLRHVELPLAARSILAGIKTAAVINVGTATLGALIGAGGYGQPILTGIRLDDSGSSSKARFPPRPRAAGADRLRSAGTIMGPSNESHRSWSSSIAMAYWWTASRSPIALWGRCCASWASI